MNPVRLLSPVVDRPARVTLTVDPDRALYLANLRGVLATRTLEDSPVSVTVRETCMQWAEASFQPSAVRRMMPTGLCLYGPTKSGKTGLAAALVRAMWWRENAPNHSPPPSTVWHLLANTRLDDAEWREMADALWAQCALPPALFITWVELERRLRAALAGGYFDALLDALEEQVSLLVLDDLDVGAHTPWRESVLFALLERPARYRKIIVTLNAMPDAPTALLTDRLISRLTNPELYLGLDVR